MRSDRAMYSRERRRRTVFAGALLAGVLGALPLMAVPVQLVQRASPSVFSTRTDTFDAGDVAVSLLAPDAINDYAFTHWTLDGQRVNSPVGDAMNPLVFTILGDETVEAHYVWTFGGTLADLDGDYLPDAFEVRMTGSTNTHPSADGDVDGFTLKDEYIRHTHPALLDRPVAGGVAVADSANANYIFNTQYVEIVERADTIGIFAPRRRVVQLGGQYVSTPLNGIYGQATNRFVYWTQGGMPMLDAIGTPLPSAVFTVTGATTLVAAFVPADSNSDDDALPDWYEYAHRQGLGYDATLDGDGDGFDFVTEFQRDTHPGLSNAVVVGGITHFETGLFGVNLSDWPSLEISSQPGGRVASSLRFAAPGSLQITPVAPQFWGDGTRFGYWTLNGNIARDGTGVPWNPLPVTLVSNAVAVAHYIDPDLDADKDGVPDGFEIAYFGATSVDGGDDSDADGIGLAVEYRHSISPRVVDDVVPGGVTWSDSATFGVDLRFFPPVRDVLVDGRSENFFGSSPTTPGTFVAGNGWSHPALGDWDGDGDLDLFVGSKAGVLRIFENTGSPVHMNLVERTPHFSALASQWSNNELVRPALGDWDGDGRADLAIGSRSGSVALIQSSGHFATNQISAHVAQIQFPGAINVVPTFGRFRGTTFKELVVLVDGGRAQYSVGSPGLTPEAITEIAPNVLEQRVPDAWSIASPNRPFNDLEAELFVSDRAGQIWQFRHNSPYAYTPISKIYAGTSDGFAEGLSITLGDIDGDGDEDVMCGFMQGGLMLLRNNGSTLLISPPSTTLVAGDDLVFSVLNSTNALDWQLWQDASGASLGATTGVYRAGLQAGVTDTLRVSSPDGRAGLAFANVISSDEISQAGKAVIVAGGRSLDDPVWLATDHVADFAYSALRFRGYSKDNLKYHSFQPNQDVDGNGIFDDIDGSSAFAAVADTFTNWVGNADKLFVYFANHGSDAAGLGYFRLNAAETLSAAQLNSWLDPLQAANTNLDVVVVLDFCYSGSFIDELAYTGTASRVVLASAAGDELTYFIAGGLVSFSDVFFAGILQGQNLAAAFAQAALAMNAYQSPGMDDNGDGLYQPGVDGVLAATITPGASFIVGRDFPTIGAVSPSQIITGDVAFVWADEVSGAYPIERVWCNLIAPSHSPDTDAGVPVVDVPEFELQYDPQSRRYVANISGFVESGTYQVNVFARDIWQGISYPKQTFVTQGGYDERLIILSGGATNLPNWHSINTVANSAYNTALARRVDAERIYYISPAFQDANGDGTNDVDALPTLDMLSTVMTNWVGPADKLTLYVIGNRSGEGLQLNATESLNALMLDSWLDDFQVSERPVQIVLEFFGAGGWISALRPPAGRERITVASARSNRAVSWAADGLVSFSQFFFNFIFQGETIGHAYDGARAAIRRASGRLRQSPEIDDNGDGIASTKNVDGTTARDRYIGPAFLTGDDIPSIGRIVPPTLLVATNTATLWAADVLDVDGISNVWVQITTPEHDGVSPMPVLDLPWSPQNERYEAQWDGFNRHGLYTLSIFATDTLGQRSPAAQTEFTVSVPFNQPDAFEVDDAVTEASVYQTVQVHTFHTETDVDWARIYMLSNYVYDIETMHHGTNLDTVVSLYRELPGGVLTNIYVVDDFARDDGEITGMDYPEDGYYLVKVEQYPVNEWTPAGYSLIINIPSGAGQYIVMGLDALNDAALPAGTFVEVDGGVEAVPFNGNKSVLLDLAPGPHDLRVQAPDGYFPVQSVVAAGQVSNPQNEVFGNPRAIGADNVSIGPAGFTAFAFMPGVRMQGRVRDALTGVWLPNVQLAFTPASGPLRGTTFDRYPHNAAYAQPWRTDASGLFPTNAIIFADTVHSLLLQRTNYVMHVPGGLSVTSALPGSSQSLGLLTLVPEDDNGNGISDAWERQYLGGTNANPLLDSDGDGRSDWQEYLSGTLPDDPGSVLELQSTDGPTRSMAPFALTWYAIGGVTYDVLHTAALGSNTWSRVFGPWTAPSNGLHGWSDTDSTNHSRGLYRINVLGP